jgi:hypothetical protein
VSKPSAYLQMAHCVAVVGLLLAFVVHDAHVAKEVRPTLTLLHAQHPAAHRRVAEAAHLSPLAIAAMRLCSGSTDMLCAP